MVRLKPLYLLRNYSYAFHMQHMMFVTIHTLPMQIEMGNRLATAPHLFKNVAYEKFKFSYSRTCIHFIYSFLWTVLVIDPLHSVPL